MNSGIYKILNSCNGKLYIGSSLNITKRWWEHKKGLRLGNHPNAHLQSSWDSYGEEQFEFSIVERCLPSELLTREQYYIDVLNPEYNICKIAGNNLGIKHSDKANKDKSLRQKGHSVSNETRAKISATLMGHKHSQETKNKLAYFFTGKPRNLPKEVLESISSSHLGNKYAAGYKHTPEAREKISIASKAHALARKQKKEIEKGLPILDTLNDTGR